MNNRKQYITRSLIAFGIFTTCSALPGNAADPGLAPEVVSSSFEENGEECASITINGEEVITYRGEIDGDSAEERAQSLAEKLEEILEDERGSIESLLPCRDGNQSAVRANGRILLKFAPPISSEDQEEAGKLAVKTSLQIINALRLACGSTKLPESINNFAEAAAAGRLATLEGDDSFSGRASWYGPKFHGRRTSNGERFDQEGMTAAHRTLPFGTKLLVTNRGTGRSCVVKVNDRGPYKDNRVLDLSKGAARELNMVSSGVAMVDIHVLQ